MTYDETKAEALEALCPESYANYHIRLDVFKDPWMPGIRHAVRPKDCPDTLDVEVEGVHEAMIFGHRLGTRNLHPFLCPVALWWQWEAAGAIKRLPFDFKL